LSKSQVLREAGGVNEDEGGDYEDNKRPCVTEGTSSSAIAEIAPQGGLVRAESGRLELGDNIYGHYRSIQPL